ncbi:MAG: peptidoglycan DD-metalloendopeptidase family protein [candidate division Zixibacteria bacterium]|nr:peptidoglycan DD-metalloendopeptidase family protein [candidate division Zixibacteria bacterium]
MDIAVLSGARKQEISSNDNCISMKFRIHNKRAIIKTFAILILCVSFTVYGKDDDEIEVNKENLGQIRDEIESKRERMKSLVKNEKSVLGNIRSLEENIDLTNAFIRKLNRTSNLLLGQINRLSVRIDSCLTELDMAQILFYSHLEAVYKRNKGRPKLASLLAGTLPEAIRAYHNSQSLIQYDNELVETIRDLISQVEKDRNRLTENRTDLSKVKKERNYEKSNLSKEKSKRSKLLSRVRSEKKLQLEAIAHLEKEAAKLQSIIEDLEATADRDEELGPDSETAFYRFKKRLPWPVKGSISLRYGDIIHPIYQTKTFNPGIDISTPYGSAVIAVADGRVAHSSYLRGYGNFVIIDHEESYYSLYSRLSEVSVEVNQLVLKGDVIGKVGDAGEGAKPALHFEFRRGKKTFNPLTWLE